MNKRSVVGALVGIGVLLQIFIGEAGLAAGSLRDVHATIGLAGLAVVAGYLYLNRANRLIAAVTAIILLVTATQAVFGLSLYGLLNIGMTQSVLEANHRSTAYLILALGLAVSALTAVLRRKK
jgi:glucan phosphoethanolaminetransferase (alkaline phosphatase superfamily)